MLFKSKSPFVSCEDKHFLKHRLFHVPFFHEMPIKEFLNFKYFLEGASLPFVGFSPFPSKSQLKNKE